jgi:methylenetetrahydrofolate dehydrogenase (NADP+)/methenyltetrahydrofolate cyclohydrolase
MKIDGRTIATAILEDLRQKVLALKEKGVTPTLAVILIGDVASSEIYVKQKALKVEQIGAKLQIFRFDETTNNQQLENLIKKLDADNNIHGIILQRPAPKEIAVEKLEGFISPDKEIDGFGQNSLYIVPVAGAVLRMLKSAFDYKEIGEGFSDWLKTQRLAVVGKGETAGQPIINLLRKNGVKPTIIDSKTQNTNEILQNADIVISAVGKRGIVNISALKKGVILIGVGLSADDEGKTRGDFDNNQAEQIASFYSPTPGGVGPVNVAMLMQNLVEAAENLSN